MIGQGRWRLGWVMVDCSILCCSEHSYPDLQLVPSSLFGLQLPWQGRGGHSGGPSGHQPTGIVPDDFNGQFCMFR